MSISIVGVGESDYSRRSGRTEGELAFEAVTRALADAGLQPTDVDGFVIEGMLTAHSVPPDEMAQALGLRERPFSAQVSIAGAGLVAAPEMARVAIEAGLADVVVTYFAISLSAKTGGVYAVHAENRWKAEFEMPSGWYGQPVYFAGLAQRYAHEYSLEPDHLATVAMAARDYATRTPNALMQSPLTPGEYELSPMIATPLRKADCCLTNDGAIAFVMTSAERARDLQAPSVRVGGVAVVAGGSTQAEYFTQKQSYLSLMTGEASAVALGQAGVGIRDVDVAELYDCFSITTLLQLEDLGVAPRGDGGAWLLENGLGPKSPFPVNTHGGLLAHSYLIAGNHMVEAVRQLRGERGVGQIPGAEVALVTGLGIPDMACAVLTTER